MTAATMPMSTQPTGRWVSSPASEKHNLETADLVVRHLEGDPRAFGEIVKRYQTRLLNFIYRMIGDRERAEDLVQEAFIRVYRHLHRFDSHQEVLDLGLHHRVQPGQERAAQPQPLAAGVLPVQPLQARRGPRPLQFEDSRSRPDDMFQNRHLKALVDSAVAQLSPHHRQVFVLRELEGKSYEEIAEVTHCNLGTVKSRLNRARASFAEMIAPYLD